MTPDPYGSEADLGLVPGGRVKVVKSTSIDIASQPARRATERLAVYGKLSKKNSVWISKLND